MKKKLKLTNPLLLGLKDHLFEQGISQEEAARAIGVSYVTLNRWMNGHTGVNLSGLTEKAIREFIDGELK